MPPIDYNIPLQVKPAQFNDPMESYGKAMTLRKLALESQKEQMAMDGQSRLSDFYRNSVGVDGKVNRKQFLQDVARSEGPETWSKYAKTFSDQDQAEAAAEKAKIENVTNHLNLVGQALNGVEQNPTVQAVARALQGLSSQGIDVSNEQVPQTDAEVLPWLKERQATALEYGDILKLKHDDATLAEQRRHHDNTNARGWATINNTKDYRNQYLDDRFGSKNKPVSTFIRPTEKQIEGALPEVMAQFPELDEASARLAARDYTGKVLAKTKAGMPLDEAQSEAMQELSASVSPAVETGWFDRKLDQPARYTPGKLKPAQTTPATPKEITTQAEYDALPSGATYLEDGKPFRKP